MTWYIDDEALRARKDSWANPKTGIDALNLPARVYNQLWRTGIDTIEALQKHADEDFHNLPLTPWGTHAMIGPVATAQIKWALDEHRRETRPSFWSRLWKPARR